MKSQRFLMSLAILATLLALTVGLTQAGGTGPQEVVTSQVSAGNAFTYQGHLNDGGNPANGEYDFQFILYNASSGGSQVGSVVAKDNVAVANGLFSVALNFGGVFDGTGLWLDVAVRPGTSTGAYTILSPRQEITPAPYALYALNVPNHNHLGENWSGSQRNALTVQTNNVADGARAIYGHANGASGVTTGVTGQSSSTSGRGVLGHATSSTGLTVGVFGKAESPGGYGGYFENGAGGYALYVGNDVRQAGGADGLVKAAAFASCGGLSPTMYRFFNMVNFNVYIHLWGMAPYTGSCRLDFDFDLSNRFWAATATDNTGTLVSCMQSTTKDELNCMRFDHTGARATGDIMVLVY